MPTTTTTTPKWLGKRIPRAAKPRPTTTTTTTRPTSPPPAAAATQPQPSLPPPPPTPPAAPKAPSPKGGPRGNPSLTKKASTRSQRVRELRAAPVDVDVEALADALVAKADRPEVAQLLRPDLPDMLRAMLVGAKVPGSFGMGERAALFRMAGLPVERSKAEGDSDKARLNDVAGRLERAIGMQARLVEAHVTRPPGQESVTAEGGAQPEPPESLRFDA